MNDKILTGILFTARIGQLLYWFDKLFVCFCLSNFWLNRIYFLKTQYHWLPLHCHSVKIKHTQTHTRACTVSVRKQREEVTQRFTLPVPCTFSSCFNRPILNMYWGLFFRAVINETLKMFIDAASKEWNPFISNTPCKLSKSAKCWQYFSYTTAH